MKQPNQITQTKFRPFINAEGNTQFTRTCDNCKGAVVVGSNDERRFIRRHGVNCKQIARKKFAKELAAGTRSVDADSDMRKLERSFDRATDREDEYTYDKRYEGQ